MPHHVTSDKKIIAFRIIPQKLSNFSNILYYKFSFPFYESFCPEWKTGGSLPYLWQN